MAIDESTIRQVLQAYLDGWNGDDPERLIGLFAQDAVVEDPVGTEPLRGIDQIRSFFTQAHAVTTLSLDSEIRTSHSNQGAMAFTIRIQTEGKPVEIRAIDVMAISDDGKIQDMKAYWGPSDTGPN